MTRHFILTDPQVKPGQSLDYLSWAGEYCAEKTPDVIVCIGDFADMPSLSSYDVGKKSFEGRTYQADIAAVQAGMAHFMAPILKEQLKREVGHRKRWNPRLVLTLGNHEHRITRAIDDDRKLEGLISLDDLKYEFWGWEVYPFLQPIVIDGVAYAHYFTSGVMGRPIGSARMSINKLHMSSVAGHQQGRDVAYAKRADGRRMTSIIAGSYYEHDESYMGIQGNQHWRGCVLLNQVSEGEFDECFISIDYLCRKYDKNI